MKKVLKYIVNFPFNLRNKLVDKKLKYLSEEQKFTLIYKTKYWTSFKFGSASGFGSNLNTTEKIRKAIPAILAKYRVSSMLDLPCGDFYWMSKVNLGDTRYIGGDIVADIIDKNNKKFSSEKYNFIKINLLDDKLPKVDLIFTRDCLVHLTNEQVLRALENIIDSGSKYFMTTIFDNVSENTTHTNGDRWRPINLMLEPFNLPMPIEIVDDSFDAGGVDRFKKMAIWDIASLKIEIQSSINL